MSLVPYLPLNRFQRDDDLSSLIDPFFLFLTENCAGSSGYSLSGRLEGQGKNQVTIKSTAEELVVSSQLVVPSLGTLRGDPWKEGYKHIVFDVTHPQHFREMLNYFKGLMYNNRLSPLNSRGIDVFAPGSGMPQGHSVAFLNDQKDGIMFYGWRKLPTSVRDRFEQDYGVLERR